MLWYKFIDEKTRSGLMIKELVQDPFIIIRDNASYHCSQQTKEWIKKKQSKGNFRLASQFTWLKPYRERMGNNKEGVTKGKY